MVKILSIFGTRPEAIKIAPVIRELEKCPKQFELITCVTAQHREMLDQTLNLFQIRPKYDMDIMKPCQSLFDTTMAVMSELESILEIEKPDMVLVQGDTTTTFSASLSAFYLGVRIGHIEAGLRTSQKRSPFPEEMNRRLTDILADLYFVPTERARDNLLEENISGEKIFVTGNTVIDALFALPDRTKDVDLCSLKGLEHIDPSRKLILVTGHRRENFGRRFGNICHALREVALQHSDVEIIYPVHLNPNVLEPARKILGHIDRVHLIEPLDYESFVWLMSRSYLILTDSGGIQEEAPSLGKPVLVTRGITERPEAIEAGTAKLVGTSKESIVETMGELLVDSEKYASMSKAINPYGDGKAAQRIVTHLIEYFQV